MQFMTHKALLVSIEMEAVLDNTATAHVLAIEAPPDADPAPANGDAESTAHAVNGGAQGQGAEQQLLNGVRHQEGADDAALLPAAKPPMSTTSSAKERAGWAQYSWLARFHSGKGSIAGGCLGEGVAVGLEAPGLKVPSCCV